MFADLIRIEQQGTTFYDVENSFAYFSECFTKVFGEAIVQNRIGDAQVRVCENVAENLYWNRQACRLVQLKWFQHENNLQIDNGRPMFMIFN